MSPRLISAGLIAAALFAGHVQAQPAPDTRQACRSSALTLCRDEVKAGDRSAIRACLIRNFDKTTPECQAAMKAQAARESQKPADAPPHP